MGGVRVMTSMSAHCVLPRSAARAASAPFADAEPSSLVPPTALKATTAAAATNAITRTQPCHDTNLIPSTIRPRLVSQQQAILFARRRCEGHRLLQAGMAAAGGLCVA